MAFALPLFVHLFDLFQPTGRARGWGRSDPAPTRHSSAPPVASARIDSLLHPAPAAQRSWGGPIRSAPLQRPLRVVRVVDDRQACAGAGRMVISGRMADVCAELDRLAELETRH